MQQEERLSSSYFKYLGVFISAGFLLYALAHHFIEPNLLFNGLRTPNLFFCFGLILIVMSKQDIEDEYSDQVRLYAHSMISIFFIVFIFMDELEGEKYSFLTELTAFLLIYLLIYYYSFKRGVGWIKNPKFKVHLLWVIIFIVVLISQNILWTA